MRNLKRALSLALASVMLMGMMVVGASAADYDYTDSDKIVNKDAVAVTSAIGVFAGYEDGAFHADKTVTRAQMAKIIYTMLTGSDKASATASGFEDAAGHWADSYIAYCKSKGIINGVSDTKFAPDSTVTTAQASKMICVALGYLNAKDPAVADTAWDLAAMAQAAELKLGVDGLTSDAGLSRDNVALLVFNALNEIPVKYNTTFDVYYNGGSWTAGILPNNGTTIITLMEKNFKDLDDAVVYDNMGRPCTEYSIDAEVVATVPFAAEATYVAGAAIKTINAGMEEKLTDCTVAALAADVYLNGTTLTNNSDLNAYFSDSAADTNDTLKNGYVIEAYDDIAGNGMGTSGVNADSRYVLYNYIQDDVSRVYTNSDDKTFACVGSYEFETSAFAKGDMIIYTLGKDGSTTVVTSMAAADSVQGTVTGYAASYVLIDGTKYTLSANGVANNGDAIVAHNNALKDTYKLYLDPNGYVVGSEKIDDGYAAGQYLMVTANIAGLASATTKVVFADGTEAVIDVVKVTNNAGAATADNAAGSAIDGAITTTDVYSYTEDDGEYTLVAMTASADSMNMSGVAAAAHTATTDSALSVDKGEFDFNGTYYYTADTTFIDVNEGVSYVGFENVPNFFTGATIGYVYETGKTAIQYAFVIGTADTTSSDEDYVYFGDITKYYTETDGDTTYTVYTDAYVDGVKTDLKVKTGATILDSSDVATSVAAGSAFRIAGINEDGYVTKLDKEFGIGDAIDVEMVSGSNFWLGTTKYTVNDDSVIVVIVEDNNATNNDYVAGGDMGDIFKDGSDIDGTGSSTDTCAVKVVKSTTGTVELAYVYVTYNVG